ncbi:MAG: beta-ketoacyl-ACP synthase III [Myxococcota bacterium]
MSAYIAGTGSYLPSNVVRNRDLSEVYGIDSDDEWIVRRTGIEERRFAERGVGPSDLAVPAAQEAIERAGLTAEDIDMIIFATLSPEYAFPGSGVLLGDKLGMHGVPALDVRNQCSGFIYALATATSMVKSGAVKHCLVVGAEVHSAALDLTTRGRNVATIFGDGAGAAVVSATSEDERGVLLWQLGADGRYSEHLMQKVWDTRQRPFIPLDEKGRGIVEPSAMWAQMNGSSVFKNAVEKMSLTLLALCWDAGISFEDISHFVLHQANLRINQAVMEQLNLPVQRVPSTVHKYGNTTAGTIPILLSELDRERRLVPGQLVALAAFGSGFTWGGALIRW